MTSTRLHTHSSFPAPNPHAGASSAQSKSHVLAGVQDAYWSDDEAEDAECPLCLEEMDIADLNFKPCLCGYQICRFCWHHIKENLNGRCPACRRDYSDENVQFKPINKEDHKRLTQQKKQRERERKDLEVLGRRQLANVRVVQRNVVYVLGMGPRFAKEELIPTLRSNEYFGQYGKISKIVLVKRTSSGGRTPVVGLYITYHRREDAARAIAAVDGATSPGGGSDVMRASYGTAKYCMTFLRGNSCNDHSCMNLHEWGDEKDCFTKEDLSTLKHTMKDMENRPRTTVTGKKAEDSDAGLPRGASWAQKGATASHGSPFSVIQAASTSTSSRQPRRGTGTRQPRGAASPAISAATRRTAVALGSPKPASQASSSRPSTPAVPRAATSAEAKPVRQKEPPAAQSPHPSPPRSPTSSAAIESDVGSGSGLPEVVTAPPAVRPQSTDSAQSSVPSVPPGLPTVPPGLSAPPGLPPPKRITSPQSSLVPSISQSSYQMSTQARALLDDVKARWEAPLPTSVSSPFPDFDRMLQMLSGDGGGFSFNLDPKLAGDTSDSPDVTGLDSGPSIPFQGSYMDAFPGLRPPNQQPSNPYMSPPPGLVYSPTPSSAMYNPLAASGGDSLRPDSAGASSYTGSFNPFADGQEDSKSPSRHDSLDDDRKVSRFNFARGRQGSTTTSSPLHTTAPLGANDNVSHGPFYNSPRLSSPSIHSQPQWTVQTRQHVDYPHHHPPSAMSSPLAQHAQAYPQPTSRFQPFDEGVSEAQLRDFIQSSRDRVNPRNPQYGRRLLFV
ncbi:hypothetical protein JAAARDRAFT_153554 [Jaapia argillacea MUCL 33604]|uniref:RING-type domain-containing protein n=1 Tax=Jaapia argillacea MUCL 33604 TaxID=933084 RepID=A0A067PY12_9AGAM|nr:hypothetical protein JAAARDRAFT_153554 [Jaapia argillacea MUCL 33604]